MDKPGETFFPGPCTVKCDRSCVGFFFFGVCVCARRLSLYFDVGEQCVLFFCGTSPLLHRSGCPLAPYRLYNALLVHLLANIVRARSRDFSPSCLGFGLRTARHAATPEAHSGPVAGPHGSFVTGSTFFFFFGGRGGHAVLVSGEHLQRGEESRKERVSSSDRRKGEIISESVIYL